MEMTIIFFTGLILLILMILFISVLILKIRMIVKANRPTFRKCRLSLKKGKSISSIVSSLYLIVNYWPKRIVDAEKILNNRHDIEDKELLQRIILKSKDLTHDL